jgi:hypothetical protein
VPDLAEISKIARVQRVLAQLSDYDLDVVCVLLRDDGPDTRRIMRRAVDGLRALRKAA